MQRFFDFDEKNVGERGTFGRDNFQQFCVCMESFI